MADLNARSAPLSSLLDAALDHGHGASAALHVADETWSFADLAERSEQLGTWGSACAPRGGVVAIIGENHPDWVAAYYGIPAHSRVLCFLNHRLSPGELTSQIERAGAQGLVASPSQAARLHGHISARLPILEFGAELPPAKQGRSEDGTSLESPAWLLFTSGTTGAPKGALLTSRSIMAALKSGADARPIDPGEVFAFPFPLCHVAGYNVLRLHAAGRPVVLLERFDPSDFIDAVERSHVTSATMAATMLASLRDHLNLHPQETTRLATLATLAYGASPMPPELLRWADRTLGVALSQGYGMTELSGNAVFLDAAEHRRGLDGDPTVLLAAGRPGDGVEVEIRDPAGVPLGIGETGEITVRGHQIMQGYLDDDRATELAIVDGWLRTGDGGRWRPDGLLEVVDRLKDVIVTGGENVASLEVENAIREHVAAVREVAVVAVPDETWGENVCAVVALFPGTTLDLDGLAASLTDKIAGFKIPRHLIIVETLPLTHSGKVAKAQLRSLIADDPAVAGPRRGS